MKYKGSEKKKRTVYADSREEEEKPGKSRKSNPSTKRLNPHELHRLIRKQAYNIYQERVQSSLGGDDLSDWLQAEEELKESDVKGRKTK